MTRYAAIAWTTFAACAALAVPTVALGLLNLDTPTPRGMSLGSKAIELVFPIALLTFPAVGALIASRRPGNRIAWLLLLTGFAGELLFLDEQYALYANLTAPGRLPAGELVLWLASWTWAPLTALLALLLALFPDGRLPSPRWRFIVWCAVLGAAGQGSDAFRSHYDFGAAVILNPLGIGMSDEVREALFVVGSLLWVAAMLGAIGSLVARYRHAREDERQQIKWFVFASGGSGALITAALFFYGTEFTEVAAGVSALSALAIPVAIAIAVLRYRLYDIDLLIHRTLVYGAVTATLIATYALAVLFFQQLFRPLTAGSDLTIAASTLAVAALFQPVRRRIQEAVDRRFYRRRYDAQRTLASFSARLRHEIDLDALTSELVLVARDTMQPASVSLWLRPTSGTR